MDLSTPTPTPLSPCDRCRAAVRDGWTLLMVRSGPLRPDRRQLALCAPCAAELGEFLAGHDVGNHHRRPG